MTPPTVQPLAMSSGDLLADRRYGFARDLAGRGDLEAAADLMAQAAAIAPDFTAAWFALGDLRLLLDDRAGAIAAFRQAWALDPDDCCGAGLKLARLGASPEGEAMSPNYVRALFDQYAPGFDAAIDRLGYRGPALLAAAIAEHCRRLGRPLHFSTVLDLGCGTGLSGAALRPVAGRLVGVDLSPGMVAQARTKRLYDDLTVGDIVTFLAGEIAAGKSYDLIVACDVLVYVSDINPAVAGAARCLAPDGILAFTVETHDGAGVALGEKLRYAHSQSIVHEALARAGLRPLAISPVSTRREAGMAVPGLLALAVPDRTLDAASNRR